jgi:SAM-dependent methyltransferase
MLDVGCGSGWFLVKMREKGWDVKGVEPSAAAAKLGRSEHSLDIFAGTLPDASFCDESFDYIRFNHSFEHVSDPNRVLAEVHRILRKNGKVMIGVPNRAGMNARLFGPYWWHLALPLHVFSYSTTTLSRMFEKHSFKVEKVIHNTEKTGIMGSLQLFFNRKDQPAQCQGRITHIKESQIVCSWVAHLQNAFHIADVIEITAVKH